MPESLDRRVPAVVNTPWLKQLPPATRFAFYGDSRARSVLAPVWGVELSSEPCRARSREARASLWLGPDEYLLLDWETGRPAASLAAALEAALVAVPHALVDVSHRQTALEISGAHAVAILNGGCPLDLDLVAFPVGMCTRTVFAKANIVMWRTGEAAFHVEVGRSFAGYVSGLLTEIAREFETAA